MTLEQVLAMLEQMEQRVTVADNPDGTFAAVIRTTDGGEERLAGTDLKVANDAYQAAGAVRHALSLAWREVKRALDAETVAAAIAVAEWSVCKQCGRDMARNFTVQVSSWTHQAYAVGSDGVLYRTPDQDYTELAQEESERFVNCGHCESEADHAAATRLLKLAEDAPLAN